ncbi:DUF808 domain-containing protein [Novosphingobium sp. LASN5T]|uniref:DUF808 domain-containing protein n=1 Tax=Novosphingobium sp. LASN5T TaxID=2491021 RepID=UPI000F5DD5A2|nr:DUF808 domain-containing protein [Novosphingobium sp. LASN5T]RQW44252.1 DUF808 domain-containing protein [Novosphingobium sp. LASN5T]
MPSGLVALLDDVSVIARAAAASLDDVSAAAGKAGAKAAGVVIDDAAVTPSYVTGFTPDRELPVIFRIARGSLRNKLLFLLPIALILSEFLPAAVVPLLMLGGLYLSFEGAEKVMEKLGGDKHGETLDGPVGDVAAFEHQRVAGAVRTDFILSAEIMAIALAEVSGQGLIARAIILAIVGILITIAVYGAVGVIVKMDDIGLHLARRPGAGAMTRRFGRMLVAAMPRVMWLLATVGTAAMLWVGGGILLHGADELGFHHPAALAHGIQHAVQAGVGQGVPGGVAGWLAYAGVSAVVGLVVGTVLAMVVHLFGAMRRGAGD